MRETEYEKGRGNAIAKVRHCLKQVLACDRIEIEEPNELSELFDEVHGLVLLRHALQLTLGMEPYRKEDK